MAKSKKELRRESRAEATELDNLSNAGAVDWGTASVFDETVRNNILRLGGIPDAPDSTDPVFVLSHQVNWPTCAFSSSENRYRTANIVELDDIAIQDSVWPWCRNFQFSVNGEFYPGWKDDFVGTGSPFVPIGSDDHYFYFITQNDSNNCDPMVYCVDHETVEETPYNRDESTIGALIENFIAT